MTEEQPGYIPALIDPVALQAAAAQPDSAESRHAYMVTMIEDTIRDFKSIPVSMQIVKTELGGILDTQLFIEQLWHSHHAAKPKNQILDSASMNVLNETYHRMLSSELITESTKAVLDEVKQVLERLQVVENALEVGTIAVNAVVKGRLGSLSVVRDMKEAENEARDTGQETRRMLLDKGRSFSMN